MLISKELKKELVAPILYRSGRIENYFLERNNLLKLPIFPGLN